MQIPSLLQSSLLGQNQNGELAGHLLSTLTTYKYPEHGPSVLEVVDIQKKIPTLSGSNAYQLRPKSWRVCELFGTFWMR